MNKKYLIPIILSLMVISVVYLALNTSSEDPSNFTGLVTGSLSIENQSNQTYKIGYCPTMEIYLYLLNEENVEIIEYSSSGKALSKLDQGDIDGVIIGRKARENEYSADGRILKEGYTLVSKEGGLIYSHQLDQITTHTYLDEEIEEIFSELRINYHKSLEQINKDALILINWEDWKEELELVIPIYNDGSKDERFRTPILYSKEDVNSEKLLE